MARDQSGQSPEVWILDRSEIAQDDHGAQLRAAAVRVWPKVETFARRELSGSSLAGETSLAGCGKTVGTPFRGPNSRFSAAC